MEYWTWGEIRNKIEKDYDIQEDPDFLADNELMEYLNEAIDKCEQHFIKIPGYFLATSTLNLVAGTRDYDLPSDIYANKIRNIVHDTEFYEIRQLRNLKDRAFLEQSSGAQMKYIIINNKGAAPKLRLIPTPINDATATLEYTRNASRINAEDGDEQVVDVPEAMGFIFTYLKWKLELKEKLIQAALATKADLAEEKQDMIDALATFVDDENNQIEPDTSIMEDMI